MTEPPAQRMPSPNRAPEPEAMSVVPWKYSAELFDMPLPFRLNVSFEMLAAPVPARFAPAALTELAQPLPAVPLLPHGHARPVPSPKQAAVKAGGGPPFWWICRPSNVAYV